VLCSTVTNPDTSYGVYFEDKVIDGIYHIWDREEYSYLASAKEHINDIIVDNPEWKDRLTVFKITVEKVSDNA
jgi:hypothetical protein